LRRFFCAGRFLCFYSGGWPPACGFLVTAPAAPRDRRAGHNKKTCSRMKHGFLTIRGPGGSPYALGQPMHVYNRGEFLAVLDPVPLLRDGTEIHLEAFDPQPIVKAEGRHVGRFIFLEVCAFVTENFPQVQAISVTFSRQIDLFGGAAQLAAARAQTLLRIGATDVHISSQVDGHAGRFVVNGLWHYNQQNLEALHQVLEEERATFRARPIGSILKDRRTMMDRFRHVVLGRR